jgi:molybdenum cofactor cytidylyltransferase
MNRNIEAVILAAGYSSRAEVFKLELDLGGKTVIERCIEGMSPFCSRIIVVAGYKMETIAAILGKYPQVEIVFNSRYAEGMFTSVKEGMRHVRGRRFFFTPGDYPLISPEVCKQLLTREGEIVIPVFKGRKGHPVLFAGRIAGEILLMADTSNLRDFIYQKGFQTLTVDDEGILIDLDTQEDYRGILEKSRGRFDER